VPDATLPRFERRSPRRCWSTARSCGRRPSCRRSWRTPATTAGTRCGTCSPAPACLGRRSASALRIGRPGARSSPSTGKVVSVHNELFEGDPKSESSIREITIDDHTVQVLREWRAVKRRDRRAAREAWWTVRSNPSSRWLAGSMRPSSRSASCSVDNATRSGQAIVAATTEGHMPPCSG
jgi:hypothetical protein